MTIMRYLLLSFIGLVTLIYTVDFILRRRGVKKYSKSFGLGYLIFIIVMTCIYFSGTLGAQHQLFWILPGKVALPVSILADILAPDSMGIYIVLLATLGSLQYAAIGWCIDCMFSKDRKSLIPKRRSIVMGAIVLIGLAYWTYSNVSYLELSEYGKSEIQLRKVKSVYEKAQALTNATISSFNENKYGKAKRHAGELLELSTENRDNWIIYGGILYTSHIVLGKLELLGGKSELAVHHLLEAVKPLDRDSTMPFPPDMSLAKDLLEKGYKGAVIEFLISCKRFWLYDNGQVDRWLKEIKEGMNPDFSSNLGTFYSKPFREDNQGQPGNL